MTIEVLVTSKEGGLREAASSLQGAEVSDGSLALRISETDPGRALEALRKAGEALMKLDRRPKDFK